MVKSRINFKSLFVAGLIAGYGMFLVDKWFAGVLGGLFGMFPGTDNAWWMLTHHVEAVVFALPFAWPAIYEILPGSGWLKGVTYGFLWWLVVLLVLGSIAGALGAGPMRAMVPSGATGVISVVLLHLVYGFLLGALYAPPESVTA